MPFARILAECCGKVQKNASASIAWCGILLRGVDTGLRVVYKPKRRVMLLRQEL